MTHITNLAGLICRLCVLTVVLHTYVATIGQRCNHQAAPDRSAGLRRRLHTGVRTVTRSMYK